MMPPRSLGLFLLLSLLAGPLAAEDPPAFEDPGVSLVGVLSEEAGLRVVTKADIEESGVADLGALLESLNLPLTRNGGYGHQVGVGIRGLGSGRVAFLINGVPMNSAQNGAFDLGQVALESLQRVEVIPGGADSRFSVTGAVGGVVNLVTVPRARKDLHFWGQVSSLSYLPQAREASVFDTQGASVGLTGGGEPLSWALDATTHGASNRYADDGHGVWDVGGGGSVTWSAAGLRLVASSRGSYSVKSLSANAQTDLDTLTSVQGRADRVGGDALGTELTLSHNHHTLTWQVPSSATHHVLDTFGGRNVWTWVVRDDLWVDVGFDGEFNHLVSDDVGLVNQGSFGLFLTPVLAWGPRAEVTPSVKVVVGPGTGPVVVPKVGLVYRFDAGTVKNNYFRTFKWPTINDRLWPSDAYASGNPHLKPEDGLGSDLTWEAPLGAGVYEATVHGAYLTEAILWQSSGGLWRPENLGRALVYGLDAGLKSPVGRGLSVDGRYSLLFTNLLTDGLTLADHRRMPYKPLHTLGLGARWRWESGSVSLRGHFESIRYTSTLNLYYLPSFCTVDVTFDQALGGGLTLFSSVTNALNQGYQTVEGYPLPGAAFTVGLRVSG